MYYRIRKNWVDAVSSIHKSENLYDVTINRKSFYWRPKGEGLQGVMNEGAGKRSPSKIGVVYIFSTSC